jgi:hypothetical protein
MNYSSRFYLYAPFALLLLIAAGMGVHWWIEASALESRLDAMLTREAMPGVKIGYDSRSIGGFPFRLEAVFGDFRVEVATKDGPIVWRAEHFALHGLTYGRDELIFEAAGKQSLSWGKTHPLDFQTGSLHASAIQDSGGLARLDLDLIGFGSRAFTAERLQLHLRRGKDTIDVAASADGLRLSPPLQGALGEEIKLAALEGEVSAPRTFDGLRAGRVAWQEALEAWRKANGRLSAEPLQLDEMMGHGAVGLDEAKRPSGLIDFKIARMPDWLARNHRGKFADALRERARQAGADGAGTMGVVLGAHDGIAYLGDQPIGTVGPLY